MNLYEFQKDILEKTKEKNKVAYYLDMGLGKTFIGSEKMIELNTEFNLVICQKSKVTDWIKHFKTYYPCEYVYDLTDTKDFNAVWYATPSRKHKRICVINYDIVYRRPELLKLSNFTLMLDESSLIQNEKTKRTKTISKMNFSNLILLSGTPTDGKYEKLYSQLKLLGMKQTKTEFWNRYVNYYTYEIKTGFNVFPLLIVTGYKNVDELKMLMKNLGCVFMKSEEVIDLPKQVFTDIKIDNTSYYKKFEKNDIVKIGDTELVGDTVLNKLLYSRKLCGAFNENKLNALSDLLESSNDRFIIFYNFNSELNAIKNICKKLDKPLSVICGDEKNLANYETENNSVSVIQYQAGSMGLNLQQANKIIYFVPTLSSSMYEQSKKRIHRIGQSKTCFYYQLVVKDSVEEKIYNALALQKDYTEKLFEKE